MFTTLAAALLVSASQPPGPPRLLALPAMSWAAGDGDRRYQLDLYRHNGCVLRIGREATFTASAIACHWEVSAGGISIRARGPTRDWPFANRSPSLGFRVLDGGSAIEWIDDPRFRLERLR